MGSGKEERERVGRGKERTEWRETEREREGLQ